MHASSSTEFHIPRDATIEHMILVSSRSFKVIEAGSNRYSPHVTFY